MLVTIKTMSVAGYGEPSMSDLIEARDVAREKNCSVQLIWRRSTYGPNHENLIEGDTDLEALYEIIQKTF